MIATCLAFMTVYLNDISPYSLLARSGMSQYEFGIYSQFLVNSL